MFELCFKRGEKTLWQILKENPDIAKDWDETYGDRMIKLVFIGKDMDKQKIINQLDDCLDV